MKHRVLVPLLLFVLSLGAFAGQSAGFLAPLRNARLVYVTTLSGPQLSTAPQPEDRAAVVALEKAIRRSSRYTLVYSPQQADMILAVMSRPAEDVIAAYDRRAWQSGSYLWRGMQKDGLASPNLPLLQQLERALRQTPTS